ncbi:MAG: methyltransferase domain-containing protein, partial [Hyphomicrobiales bacterium]
MASPWNPQQYERFRDERSQPFFDLLELVEPIPGGRAIDLGCGTGELTKVMHERVQARASIGLDNSETMLEKCSQFAGNGLTFRLGTILRFAPHSPFDLVFSNAALQWVPEHYKLFERLVAGLKPGGQLAVQVPANHDHPSHVIAHEVAR